MPDPPLTILMIDDDEDDAYYARRIFTRLSRPVKFLHRADAGTVYDNVEVLRMSCGDKPGYPDLILLDINMPRASGFSILEQLKRHPTARRIPVIMFTTSDVQEHIDAAYAAGASSYVVKPHSIEDFNRFAEAFVAYWSAISRPATGAR